MTSAVVPSLNEADTIGATVDALMASGAIDEVIVVDDGSSDQTADIATAHGAIVLRLAANSGKAAALRAGVERCTGRILAFIDADLGATASEVTALVGPVLRDEADMAIAHFRPVKPGSGGFGLVVRLARWAIKRAGGADMRSPLSGQRVLHRGIWERYGDSLQGFGVEVGLTMQALADGYRVVEIPTNMTHRQTGRDIRGILHRAKQLLHVARTIATVWIRPR